MSTYLQQRVEQFSGKPNARTCRHKHKFQGTGGVFFHSMGILQCSRCFGWQLIRKPIK